MVWEKLATNAFELKRVFVVVLFRSAAALVLFKTSDAMTVKKTLPSPQDDVDFASLPWNLNLPEKHKYIHITTKDTWTSSHYDPSSDSGTLLTSVFDYNSQPLALRPATTSINYGTSVWEGLKCYRTTETESVVFRPDRNYERMAAGADELGMPMPSRALFLRAVQLAIQVNATLIPPLGPGMKLYVRPMLLGSGQQLGLYPSPEFSFIVYVSPTGPYFAGAGLNLHLELRRSRAARGGMGATKCSGNYAAAMKPLLGCKKEGFADNVFLELETYENGSVGKAIIQEMSAANIFFVLKSGEIVTPSLARKTILPGVTRESVLALIESYSDDLKAAMEASTGQSEVKAGDRDVRVEELLEATEAFCTGTAAELMSIRRVATGSNEESFEAVFPKGQEKESGPVTAAIHALLREAMAGQRMDGWTRDPYAPVDEFLA